MTIQKVSKVNFIFFSHLSHNSLSIRKLKTERKKKQKIEEKKTEINR